MFLCFLILNVLLQFLGWFTRGIVPPCQLVSCPMLCQSDHLRILYHALGHGRTVPLVKGLALVTFPHDGLHKGGRDGRHDPSAEIGATEGSGEGFDCLCFFHGSNMAHFSEFCCINGYKTGKPVGELSPLDFSTLRCKDTLLPNHNAQTCSHESYHQADWIVYVLQVLWTMLVYTQHQSSYQWTHEHCGT